MIFAIKLRNLNCSLHFKLVKMALYMNGFGNRSYFKLVDQKKLVIN